MKSKYYLTLHNLEEYTLETIQSFIDNQIEESINIEFKSNELLRTPSIKKKISKDVSTFANSDGVGIIICNPEREKS